MKFYFLKPDHKYNILWDDEMGVEHWDVIECPRTPMHRSSRRNDNVLTLKNNEHKRFGDIVFGVYNELLFTEEIIELCEELKITGYMLKEVLMKEYPKETGKLWQAKVIGTAGHIHPDSGYRVVYECPDCHGRWVTGCPNGFKINIDTWDGSDIFRVEEYPSKIIVTSKFKRLIDKKKLKGCNFILLEDEVIDGSSSLDNKSYLWETIDDVPEKYRNIYGSIFDSEKNIVKTGEKNDKKSI